MAAARPPTLVSSLEERRASLAERKNYRRARKIDDRLPQASGQLLDVFRG